LHICAGDLCFCASPRHCAPVPSRNTAEVEEKVPKNPEGRKVKTGNDGGGGGDKNTNGNGGKCGRR
jgi:hypothetical protein